MKIVIDIPDFKWLENEGDFKEAVKEYEQGTRFDKEIRNALLNGTPLLEQQPCEDCISREDALDCLTASGLKKFDFILDARDKIKNLPSVTPQQTRWIPCSERLPQTDGVYIVTRRLFDKQVDTEPYYMVDACYFDGSNTWHNDNRINHERNYLTDITAWWMSPPQPYKESEEAK